MVPKRATFFSYGNDDTCAETKRFIEDGGVLLSVRDLEKSPLTVDELRKLIGYTNIAHFLNTLSDSYIKHNLGKNFMPREEILQLMAADYTLVRRPIVQSSRLTTVGCDKTKIAQMLQLNLDGSGADEASIRNGNRRGSSRGRMQQAAARK